MDYSNGYEAVAREFLSRRGKIRSVGIGVAEVTEWAKKLPLGACVVDIGCGLGFPITSILVDQGLCVFGVEAAPSFVAAFRQNLPGVSIACEAVEASDFFGRKFDGVVAWGLMFLLEADDQRRLIYRFSEMLAPNGRLLFTSPVDSIVWVDAMTGKQSISLGAAEYRTLLNSVDIFVEQEYEDAGGNHYFDAIKRVAL